MGYLFLIPRWSLHDVEMPRYAVWPPSNLLFLEQYSRFGSLFARHQNRIVICNNIVKFRNVKDKNISCSTPSPFPKKLSNFIQIRWWPPDVIYLFYFRNWKMITLVITLLTSDSKNVTLIEINCRLYILWLCIFQIYIPFYGSRAWISENLIRQSSEC